MNGTNTVSKLQIGRSESTSIGFKMDNIQPIWDQRVLLCHDAIVVADIHIGYEYELEKKGYIIPSQTKKLMDTVSGILKETGVRRLIINGDLKHNVPTGSWQEYKEIPKVMDHWLKYVDEIHLIKGNHDGGIEGYLPHEVIVHGSTGTVIDGIGYFHGHGHPSEEVVQAEMIVTAHSHPTVQLKDGLNRNESYPCWVRFKFSKDDSVGEGILMPTLNSLLGGINITKGNYLGPFFKRYEIWDEKIYLLDGTCLGTREGLPDSEESV